MTRYDGPNHLGLWYNALPEHQMALITPIMSLIDVHRLPPPAGPECIRALTC